MRDETTKTKTTPWSAGRALSDSALQLRGQTTDSFKQSRDASRYATTLNRMHAAKCSESDKSVFLPLPPQHELLPIRCICVRLPVEAVGPKALLKLKKHNTQLLFGT